MSIDIASLGIKVDATQADNAAGSLDHLTKSGGQAERQTESLAAASNTLANQLSKTNSAVVAAHVGTTRLQQGIKGVGSASKLTANEALNLSRQFADVGVTAAMGMNPLMIMIQQGPQIADIMKTSGLSVRELGVEMLKFFGIIKILPVSQAEAAAATAALGVAEANLTKATLALTAAQEAEAAAVAAANLAKARATMTSEQLAVSLELEALAARQAAAAHDLQAASARAAAVSTMAALAPIAIAVGAIAAAIGLIAGAFALIANEAEKDLGNVQKELGLTEKQMENLKKKGVETGYTMGDAFLAFYDTVKDIIVDAFEPQISTVKGFFGELYDYIKSITLKAMKGVVGDWFSAFEQIKFIWSNLPSAISDFMIQAANITISTIEGMINKSIGLINRFTGMLPFDIGDKMQMGGVSLGRADNMFAGSMGGFGAGFDAAGVAGRGKGEQWGRERVDDFFGNMAERREARIRKGAGEAGKDAAGRKGKGGKSEAEKAAEEQERFLKGLKEETAEIGKNRVEIKELEIARAAALSPKFRAEIEAAGKAWKEANNANAIKEFRQELQDQVSQLQFEAGLIGKSNTEREEAIALRALETQIIKMQREGITITAEAIAKETAAIKQFAAEKGSLQDISDQAEIAANKAKDFASSMSELAGGMRSAFGEAGGALGDMLAKWAEYDAQTAEFQQREADAQKELLAGNLTAEKYKAEIHSIELARKEEQLDLYGSLITSAKGFFKEGTTGYKVLEAVERAYMIFRMGMKLREMLMDKVQTTQSVANSGTRAAADGVAAVSKTAASVPFPANIAAIAAIVAMLASFGIMMAGGGGGGGSASASAAAEEEKKAETLEEREARSPSILRAPNGMAMRGGSAAYGAGEGINVLVDVTGTYKEVSAEILDANTVRIIAQDEITKQTPNLMAGEARDPNSRFSRTLQQSTTVQPRRN